MKTYEGVEMLHAFLTSGLDGGVSGQVHAPAALPPGTFRGFIVIYLDKQMK
jgi:hypothetical protein